MRVARLVAIVAFLWSQTTISLAEPWTVETVREICRPDTLACALGEYLQPFVMRCLRLPTEGASEPSDTMAMVHVTMSKGQAVASYVDFGKPAPSPWEMQIGSLIDQAVIACQPYEPVSGPAIFWVTVLAQRAPTP
jgi:hypothetical protein